MKLRYQVALSFRTKMTPRFFLLLASALLATGYTQSSLASTITLLDSGDALTNGIGLVYAIHSCNNTLGSDIIVLAPGADYAVPDPEGFDPLYGHSAFPTISSDITIRGGYASATAITTIRRAHPTNLFRVFFVSAGGHLRLEYVRVSNGNVLGANYQADGGGIMIFGGNLHLFRSEVTDNQASEGGGVAIRSAVVNGQLYNSVALVEESSVTANRASGMGGGINNKWYGYLTLERSTVSNNHSEHDDPGIVTFHSFRSTNSTISGNYSGNAASTGGISLQSGQATINYTTVADNTGVSISSAFPFKAFHLSNSIVTGHNAAKPTSPALSSGDCTGNFTSHGGNVISLVNPAFSCTMVAGPADRLGTQAAPIDAKLGPLTISAGYTMTHEPQFDSPAIANGILSLGCPGVDQRGISRHWWSCDSGSFQTRARTPKGIPLPQ